MSAAVVLPVALHDQFAGFLAVGELRVQRCERCGRLRHVPRYLCPACHSDRYEWVQCSGRGVLVTWTTTQRTLHPAFPVPHTVGVVALDEGPQILAPILGTDDPSAGMTLLLAIEQSEIGGPVAAFTVEQPLQHLEREETP